MLSKIDASYKLLAKGPPATEEQISAAAEHFRSLPQEYIDLVREATEIEIVHQYGQYLRVWGPLGCVVMDEAYKIRRYMPETIPIGDDGGGHVVFYAKGNSGRGLYHVGFGNLGFEDAVWITSTLDEFLTTAKGINTFLGATS